MRSVASTVSSLSGTVNGVRCEFPSTRVSGPFGYCRKYKLSINRRPSNDDENNDRLIRLLKNKILIGWIFFEQVVRRWNVETT